MGLSNTTGNTPPEQDRAWLKSLGIGWHPRGGWCRKFPGDANRTYFGHVTPAEAIAAHNREELRRQQGQQAEQRASNLTVREAVNLFLNHLDAELAGGKIGPSQRARYGREIDHFVRGVGRNRRLGDFCRITAPDLFGKLRNAALDRGVFAGEKHVVLVRAFLDWCSRRRFIPAPFYADAFDAPGIKEKRAARKDARRGKGLAYWQPAEVREIVDAARADPHFHAQILLVLNGGMGATDLSHLEDGDIDWQRQCIHTERSKTLVPRVVPLWDITVEAMRASRAVRAKPADPQYARRFFLTLHGKPLVIEQMGDDGISTARTDSVKNKFYRLLSRPALRHLKRHRGGFYSLRSVFATPSLGHGQDRNLEAVILGQQFDRPILEYYVRDDQRAKLRAIVDFVRHQIWPQ